MHGYFVGCVADAFRYDIAGLLGLRLHFLHLILLPLMGSWVMVALFFLDV